MYVSNLYTRLCFCIELYFNMLQVDVDDAWNLVGCLDTHLERIRYDVSSNLHTSSHPDVSAIGWGVTYVMCTMSSSGSRQRLTRQEKRDRRLAAIISKSVAKAVSEVYENASKSSEGSHADTPKDSIKTAFSFKQFKACGPKEFTGEDGPTAMYHWFDPVEVTLRQSGCPENLRTLNATGVFQSRALDWWTADACVV
ncbi:hypothetical protein Hanom_Chr16g01500271 [Helianthus anomalus]